MQYYKVATFLTLLFGPLFYLIPITIKVQELDSDFVAGLAENELCDVPTLEPFDPTIAHHRKKIHVKCRNPQLHLAETRLNYLHLKPLPFVNYSKLNCCYVPYLTRKLILSGKFANECVPFDKPTRMEHQFFKVECRFESSPIYSEYMSVVLPTRKKSPNQLNRMNVAVLIVDGVSRLSFHRNLPKTSNYLRKLGAIEFGKFHRVDENGFPNMMALMTGLKRPEYDACWLNTLDNVDDCPFIWKEFARHGYVTALVEDHLDTFEAQTDGFAEQPVDYYYRPFNRILDGVKDDPSNAKNRFRYICAADKPVHVWMMQYCNKILERIFVDRSKFFAMFHTNTISYDNAMLPSADDEFVKFMKNAVRKQLLNNTFLVFMSDHGSRRGVVRRSYQEFLETNLPFLFVVVPRWFERRREYENLRDNARKLVTIFDVHKTLRDLTSGDRAEIADRGISLFDRISKSRTCEEADVEPLFCACVASALTSIDTKIVAETADEMVENINDLLVYEPLCAILGLSRVIRARQSGRKVGGNVVMIWLQIETRPGTGVFEGVFRRQYGKSTVLGQIGRITGYANESGCVTDPILKAYCFCIQ